MEEKLLNWLMAFGYLSIAAFLALVIYKGITVSLEYLALIPLFLFMAVGLTLIGREIKDSYL